MEILGITTKLLNQNKYNKNLLTPEFIGSLVIYPVGVTNEKCLPCDGYKLKIADYKELHAVIGSKFNDGTEEADEFRIPDYNISKRFLQPGSDYGVKVEAGLPNITGGFYGDDYVTGCFGAFYWVTGGGHGLEIAGSGNGTIHFNASRSNGIYGASTTVQPPSQGKYKFTKKGSYYEFIFIH